MGTFVQPLLGFKYNVGVLVVGIVVVLIVVTAGMVSTTWVQFIKGTLLVAFCAVLVAAILAHVLTKSTGDLAGPIALPTARALIPPTGGWISRPYARYAKVDGGYELYHVVGKTATRAQAITKLGTQTFIDGLPKVTGPGKAGLRPVGGIQSLPDGPSRSRNMRFQLPAQPALSRYQRSGARCFHCKPLSNFLRNANLD